jgi:hypothetical protein
MGRTLESLSAKYKESEEENECFETTRKHCFALGVTADDGHEYSSLQQSGPMISSIAVTRKEAA